MMKKKTVISFFLIFVVMSINLVSATQYIEEDPNGYRYNAGDVGIEGADIEATLNDDDNDYLWCSEGFPWKDEIYVGAYGYDDPDIDHSTIDEVIVYMTWQADSWMGLTGGCDNFKMYVKLSNGDSDVYTVDTGTPASGVEYTDDYTMSSTENSDLFDLITDDDAYVTEVRLYCSVNYWGFHSDLYLNIDQIKIIYET